MGRLASVSLWSLGDPLKGKEPPGALVFSIHVPVGLPTLLKKPLNTHQHMILDESLVVQGPATVVQILITESDHRIAVRPWAILLLIILISKVSYNPLSYRYIWTKQRDIVPYLV